MKLYNKQMLFDQNSYTKNKADRLKYKFLGYENIIQNYSASYQDLFVISVLNGKQNGFYVDIGGGHPYINSNTYLLEKKYKWTGVSLDLKQELQNDWLLERKNPYLIENAISFNYSKYLKENNFPKQIDYLSLDIEPAENTLECLSKLPLNEYRFNIITYETDYYAVNINQSIEKANQIRNESRKTLFKYGYVLVNGNVSALSTNHPYEDWYVDATFLNETSYSLFMQKNDENKFYEDILLKQ